MNKPATNRTFTVPHTPHVLLPFTQPVKANVLPARPSLLEHRMELLTAQVGQLTNCGLE